MNDETTTMNGDSGRMILVVEDDQSLSHLMEALLESDGYRVRCAADGQAALDVVRTERPSLVLLDLTLPKLDGWEVLARLRDEDDAPPVVLLTGHSRATGQATHAGAAAAILKPFDVEELLRTVASLLKHDIQIDGGL